MKKPWRSYVAIWIPSGKQLADGIKKKSVFTRIDLIAFNSGKTSTSVWFGCF
jgi:hypothetical protein